MTPSVLTDAVSISLATIAPRVDACELCATGGETLRAALTIRHPRGAATSLAACDRCATALRRVVALAGATSAAGPAYVSAAVLASADHHDPHDASPDLVGAPTLIHEFAEPFIGFDGVTYIVRAWGQARADGTWIAWLTFVGIDDAVVRKTPRETSQSNYDHLQYWANGLQPSYFEGAFSRSSP